MSGTMTDNYVPRHTPIDYREAFVMAAELEAHGLDCKQCQVAAIRGNYDNFCNRMTHMREYIKRAYEALPEFYKNRYEKSVKRSIEYNHEAIKDMAGGR